VLWIENAVLHYKKSEPAVDTNATLTLTKPIFIRMMAGTAGIKDFLFNDDLKVDGSRIDLIRFLNLDRQGAGDLCHRNEITEASQSRIPDGQTMVFRSTLAVTDTVLVVFIALLASGASSFAHDRTIIDIVEVNPIAATTPEMVASCKPIPLAE
jgi:hypothetical protein